MRIRSHLLLLTAVVLVPGFLAAATAVTKVRDGEREAALRGLRETVRATASLVDGQVQRSLGALTALKNSHHLQTGNFEAFYEQARAVDQPPDVWTMLLDSTGAQRVNTGVPYGTTLPSPSAQAAVAKALATQAPVVTDLIVGAMTGRLLTTIYVPAKPSPLGRFVVAQSFSVDHWKKSALQPEGQSQWVVAVIDRTGKFISRSHRTNELLGHPARTELVAAAAAANDGLIRHSTLEGIDSYDAFTHSALTGWTIAVAAPVHTIEASATQAVTWLVAGVAMALVVALLGASLLSATLLGAIDTASAAARLLGHGDAPAPPRTSVREVNALNDALADAAGLLAAEKKARELVEQQRQQLLANERAARESAQGENAAKDKFLALLGHELRNPLAAIAGATEVLGRGAQNDTEQSRLIAVVQRQNRHLRHIVDDLLEVSRMISGKIVLEQHVLDLADCVRGCVDSLRASERALGHRWTIRTEEVWVLGDPVRLDQIVNNLVANALQFSPLGSEIVVTVSGEASDALVEVSDSGSGIPKELLPRIFEPFVQGPAVPGRPSGGVGIGLALVKQLVELHGGEISVRGGPSGVGSTFSIRLPRIAAPPSGALTAPPTSISACHVLLVEDNVDARETTVELLRDMGYEVSDAADGEAALRAANVRVPDVIVMDLGLPGRSGHQIAAEMRATPALRRVPLIALSGYGQDHDRQASLAAGFDEHLVKPVASDALAQAIEVQVARRRNEG